MEIRKKIVANVATNQIEEVEYEVSDEELALEIKQQAISEAQQRIGELKSILQSMDYKNSKIIDGDYTDEEIAKIKSTRTSMREEINLLEDKLAELGVS